MSKSDNEGVNRIQIRDSTSDKGESGRQRTVYVDANHMLQNIVDKSHDRLMVLDFEGRYLFVNDAVPQLFETSREEIIGAHISRYIAENEVESSVMPALKACFEGRSVSYQRWRDDPDGSRIFIDVDYTPFRDDDDNILGALVRVRDQTQLEVSRLKLKSANQQLNDYLSASSDWQWETDDEFCITRVSDGISDIHGVEAHVLVGERLDVLFRMNELTPDQLSLREILNEREPFRVADIEFVVGSGCHPVHLNGIPVFDHTEGFVGFRGSVTDISDFHNVKAEATIANRRFLQAIDSFSGSFALFDADEKIVRFNKTYQDLHKFLGPELKQGLSFERCLRIQLEKDMIPDARGREEDWLDQRIARFRNPGKPFEIKKGNNQWLRVTEQRLADGGCLKTMEDISEMKLVELRLRDSEQRFKNFAETAADWFFEIDAKLNVSYLSDRYEELTGISAETVVGQPCQTVFSIGVSDDDRIQFFDSLTNRTLFSDIEIVFNAGSAIAEHFALSARPRYGEEGEFLGFYGVARNVTEARRLSGLLQHQAHHDDLTGLVNRRGFYKQLKIAQHAACQKDIPSVVGFLDLDQFKIVNDSEGHVAGDRLLREISGLLGEYLRENDTLARLGGDEFGILMTDIDVAEAGHIVESLSRALRHYRFSAGDRVYSITASIGMVEVSANIEQLEEILRRADIACFTAKNLGRNQIKIYETDDEDLHRHDQEVLHASAIQQAIESDKFRLYFQPIAKTDDISADMSHFEVLLRLYDDGAVLLPGSFIPIAERFRLMPEIDRWVVSKALASYAAFNRSLGYAENHSFMTINLSGESLTDTSFANYIVELMSMHSVPADRICFEITETAVVSSFKEASKFIQQLREFGITFALDDFGSGMSSFAYLKRFSADYLKIDGSLITEIASEASDRTMVLAINQMAHVLGMKTIAEFVENQDQIDTLKELGVDFVQGYAIGKPRPMSLEYELDREVA